MTRPTALAVRRTAVDLSDQVGPHLSHAKDTLVDTVIPKAREAMVDTVIPKTRDVMVDTVIPAAKAAKTNLTDSAAPKAKAAGAAMAVKAGLMEAPKQRHPFRKAALLSVVAVGAYAAWNAWRLPKQNEDWADAPTTTRADSVSASAR